MNRIDWETLEAYCPKRRDAERVLWIFASDRKCGDIFVEDVGFGWIVSCILPVDYRREIENKVLNDKSIESVDFT